MQYVESKDFWQVVENLDQLPLGSRPVIEFDIQSESTFCTVSVGGREIGNEVSCHRTGKTRCYLTEAI